MIRTLRGKLTAFNTAVTGVILIAITILSLFVSEQDTRERTYQNFESYLKTISSNLSSQGSISSDWLRQVESAGNVAISVYDSGKPLYSLRHTHESLRNQFEEIRSRAESECHLSADRIFDGKSCTLMVTGENGAVYIGGLAVIAKEDSVLELVQLYSLEDMEKGILRQRLIVCVGEIFALTALWMFSWYFTGRMLRPIAESQRRQLQFTAAASHELRTPLAAILSAASAIERADDDGRRVFLGQIESEGHRMSRLIEDLLLLSSGDSQNWEIQKETTDLEMLLLEAYENHYFKAKQKGLALSVQIPEEDVPNILADKERLYQTIAILLDNAISYTPAPGKIKLTLLPRKHSVQILVSDTGPGVPDGEKKQIFQRFHRGEKSRSERNHFGLGLSIAAQIAALHGGKIWVRDGETGGAEFVIELPVK